MTHSTFASLVALCNTRYLGQSSSLLLSFITSVLSFILLISFSLFASGVKMHMLGNR